MVLLTVLARSVRIVNGDSISSAEKPSAGRRRIVNIVVTVGSQRVIGLVFKVN